VRAGEGERVIGHELPATIRDVAPLIRARTVSPTDLVEHCLDRVASLNTTVHAYVTVCGEQARADARDAERALQRGEYRGPLHGIPVSVKDVIETEDIPTTWGTRALAEYRPPEDATVVTKLREAGAILLGKANVDTYPYHGAPGSPTLGPTRNPWDLSRSAERSSGGSAAAVAAGFDYGSIGTDNGGSVRIPAATCGVVGLKPTFGRVSKYRVFPYSVSFDHPGPIARSVFDCASLLTAIAGHDPHDPAAVDRPVPDYTREIEEPVSGLRLGIPAEAWESNDPEVVRLVDDAVAVLGTLGMTTHRITPPGFRDALWGNVLSGLEIMELAGTLAAPSPADDALGAYMGVRARGYHARLITLGMRIRRAAQAQYAEIFRQVDLIVTPTVPATAPLLTEDSSPWERPDELFAEMAARYTRVFNFVGNPAITVPCGFTAAGLPVGLHLAGRPFDEGTLLRAAYAYERATAWHRRQPALA